MIPSSSLISTAARTSVAGMCAYIVLLCRYSCAALQPCAHPSCSLAHRSVTRALTKRGVILKKIAAKERKVQQRLRKEQGVCEHGVDWRGRVATGVTCCVCRSVQSGWRSWAKAVSHNAQSWSGRPCSRCWPSWTPWMTKSRCSSKPKWTPSLRALLCGMGRGCCGTVALWLCAWG